MGPWNDKENQGLSKKIKGTKIEYRSAKRSNTFKIEFNYSIKFQGDSKGQRVSRESKGLKNIYGVKGYEKYSNEVKCNLELQKGGKGA